MPVIPTSPNAELVLRALKYASDRELEGFRETCAEDVVLHYPFHPMGPKTFHGVDRMIRQFSAEKVFATFAIWAEELYDLGDTIIMEGRSHGTNSNDLPDYDNHYIFVVRCKDGRIVEWTEFFNPLEAMKQGYGVKKPEQDATK